MPALRDYPARHLEIRCAACDWHGVYGFAGLGRRYGAQASTHGLYLRLVATCRAEGRCQAVMNVPAGTRVARGMRSRA